MAPTGSETDVIVIGGGSTGENAADYAHRAGLDVVLVEPGLLGGECSYYACMPSKALLRPTHAIAAARRVDGAAQAVDGRADVAAVLRRRDGFTHDWDDSSQVTWVEGAGLTLVRGRARLAGPRRVRVDGPGGTSELTARHAVVLATGSEPALPDLPGLAGAGSWTTRDATSAREVPPSLVVIGGGVAGCELAQAFARLGSRVTVLARSGLLTGLPARAGELVGEGLERDGVDVRVVGTRAVRRTAAGVRVETDDGAVEAARLLVATGRRPRHADLGLAEVGLELDPGDSVPVDDSGLVQGVDGGWLYAAGDLTGRAPLTHQGKYAARAVGAAIGGRATGRLGADVAAWSDAAATADHAAVPQVVFTDPEVAHVGLRPRQARDAGHRVRTVEEDLSAVAGASLHADDPVGWARLVVDEESDAVLGATFVGQDVAELLHAATVAVVGKVPVSRLWHAVPAYPTVSEIWLRLLDADRSRTGG